MSEPINELAAALAKAQAAMAGAKKDSTNPHFKNKYADLSSVWDACRKPLSDNGLSIAQFTRTELDRTLLVTALLHSSGQTVEGEMLLPQGKNMQEMGSALTYARRYGLAAMVGVAPEDDDGNAAVASTPKPEPVKIVKPVGYDEWLLDFEAAADNGMNALAEAWQKAKSDYRTHANATDPGLKDRLKAKAAKAEAVPA